MRARPLVPLVLSAALVAAGALPGSADPGPSTHVDTLNATGGASVVSISGTATFVDAPVTIATDATGDNTPPLPGTDLTAASISRPDPSKPELHFAMSLASEVPGVFAVPETVHYSYFFAVGPDAEGGQFLLLGLRTSQYQAAGSTNPVLNLHQFRADGTCCDPKGAVAGSMAGGKVTWILPLSKIGASTGSVIEPHPGRPIQIQVGASGAQRLNSGQPDTMTADVPYTVPGPSVAVGIAPAGTPEASVPLTKAATVTGSSFSAQLTKPTDPGTYIVVAKACYLDGSCGLKSTTITI